MSVRYKRIISIFVLICTIWLLVLPTRADWTVSGGGDGNAGDISTGDYSAKMQGIRITIIDKHMLTSHTLVATLLKFHKTILRGSRFRGPLFCCRVLSAICNPSIQAVVVNRRRRQ